MADHYFSINPGEAALRRTDKWVVGTSAASSTAIEVRVTDATVRSDQVYQALEFLADLFATKNVAVIPTDFLTD